MEGKKSYFTLMRGLIAVIVVILAIVSIVSSNIKFPISIMFILLGAQSLLPISKDTSNYKIENTISKVAGILVLLFGVFLAFKYLL